MKAKVNVPVRPLYEIAQEIRQTWKKSISGTDINYAARPYLDAMASLDKTTDSYFLDNADQIIRYFLCNATSWRGDKAREIKKELNSMLKSR
jgi:hypothetical protein